MVSIFTQGALLNLIEYLNQIFRHLDTSMKQLVANYKFSDNYTQLF